jgi:hypothetical protein
MRGNSRSVFSGPDQQFRVGGAGVSWCLIRNDSEALDMLSAGKTKVSIRFHQGIAERTLLHFRMLLPGFAFRTAKSAIDDFLTTGTAHTLFLL